MASPNTNERSAAARKKVPTPSPPNLDELPPDTFVRLPAVMALSGLKRSTIYDQIKLGRFPPPEKLTAHACGWRARRLRSWLSDPTAWRAAQEVVA